ncbi:hypothetical protein ACH4JS_09750 [Streptomyces sp. NPDC017638]|uniref:hypothetical protein n=1 Tax=Streptomyces sp. NPDC017638 TaxID=3365004 RepID=UPI0037900C2D
MPRFTEFYFGVSRVMGYFHQDWHHDGDTAADVVARQLTASCDEEALALRRDARALGSLSSPVLEVLWYAGAQYMPGLAPLGGGAAWTRTLVGLCDARLSAGTEVRPFTGADAEDGMACLDAVVAEIEAARLLGSRPSDRLSGTASTSWTPSSTWSSGRSGTDGVPPRAPQGRTPSPLRTAT